MNMKLVQSAAFVPNAKQYSGPFTGGPNKILLHATIAPAMALPYYDNEATAPHVTARWDGATLIPGQHYYWDQFSKSLVNAPGGVETNRDGVRQIELAGYLDDRPGQFNILKAPDTYWNQLGLFLRPLAADLNIPNVAPTDWSQSGRMSVTEWDNFGGLCAHVHAPENNHSDLNIPAKSLAVLRAAMFGADKPYSPPPVPPVVIPRNPTFPLYRGHYFGRVSSDIKCHSGTYSAVDRSYIRTWQAKMIARGWSGIGTVDGVFGKNCETVAKQFQAEKRLGSDGKVGVLTWNATWNTPVK